MIRFVPRDFSDNTISPTAAQIQDITGYTKKEKKKATRGILLGISGAGASLAGNTALGLKVISSPGFRPTESPDGALGKLVDKINDDTSVRFEDSYGSLSPAFGPAMYTTDVVDMKTGNRIDEIINTKDGDKYSSAGILAHEYGHTMQNDGVKLGSNVAANLGNYLSPLIGVHAARRQEKAKKQGKKLGWLGRNEQWVVPAAIQLPKLGVEAGASIRGYNTLKELGASSEELKKAATETGLAFGTYATMAAVPIATSIIANQIIKRRRRRKELKNLKIAKKAATIETPDEKEITN